MARRFGNLQQSGEVPSPSPAPGARRTGPAVVLRPAWLLGHLIIVALVVLFVSLGMWQLDRLDQRKSINADIRAAESAAPVEISSAGAADGLRPYSNVQIAGTARIDKTVYVRYPLYDGRSGYYVLVPFQLADGTAIVVNRGWIPIDAGNDDSRPSSTPVAEMVSGLVRLPEKTHDRRVGSTEGNPPVPTIAAIDLDLAARAMGVEIGPLMWIQQTGPAVEAISPLPPPEITEGPHFSYALQWFSFAAIAVVGWSILVVRAIRAD